MPAIPALIGAAVGIGGAILTSNAQKSATKTAVAAQTASSDQQQALLQQIYQQNTQNEQPYLNSGYGALSVQNQLLGLKPMTADQFNSGQWYMPGTVNYGTTPPATGTGTPPATGTGTPPAAATNPITVAQHAQQAIAAGADPQMISARMQQMGVRLN